MRDDQLAALYAGMDSLPFMSKYEGFGLPVIEAAKFGRRKLFTSPSVARAIFREAY